MNGGSGLTCLKSVRLSLVVEGGLELKTQHAPSTLESSSAIPYVPGHISRIHLENG